MLRKKPHKIQIATTKQKQVETALKGANQMWKTLSQEVRDDWDKYGATCRKKSPIGTYQTLKGWNAFCRAYTLLAPRGFGVNGFTQISQAEDGYLADSIFTYSYSNGTDRVLVTWAGTELVSAIFYIGKVKINPQRKYRGSYTYLRTFAGPASFTTPLFNNPTSGSRYFIKAINYNNFGAVALGTVGFIDIP